MEDLLRRLGDPQLSIPCVHIAGSKGKGSTAAMTAAMLAAAGHRTGLFTSPHVSRFEERIQVDGVPIPPDRFEALTNRLRPVAEEMDGGPLGGPTFFELTTALAWLYFVERAVNIVVLEVGLGGRLDATNLCRPLVTIITSISRDHTRILGDTLEEIAGEKAGIIKTGIPVLTAVSDAGPLTVIRDKAAAVNAPCHIVGADIALAAHPRTDVGDAAALPHFEIDLSNPWREHHAVQVPLPGRHQTRNAALAVSAIDLLNTQTEVKVPHAAITAGLSAVEWPLRIEVVARRPWLILDAAHNEASIAALIDTLRALPARRRIAIFAASKDKDSAAMLRLLAEGFDQLILTRFINNPRATPPGELLKLSDESFAARVTLSPSPAEALELARKSASADDLICVTGSFFLAGEVRDLVLN
jgi:dihydrofolate synthase/folylpolyglutamate synthase